MMEVGKRGDFDMPEVTLRDLEDNLDTMGKAYVEMRGIDAFHDLEHYCKAVILATGDEIDGLDIPQKLFVMCYFACSWISSYVVSMNKADDMMLDRLEKFVDENNDLPLYEATKKFFEIFGGGTHE